MNSKIFTVVGFVVLLLVACEGNIKDPFNDNQTCVPIRYEEMLHVPLDMFFVLDNSGSMAGITWITIVNLLTTFFNHPASEGINVAINMMPNPDASGNTCNPNDYNPPQIPSSAPPLAVLPDDSVMLTAAIAAISPSGAETPMYGALDGTYQFAGSYLLAHPTHKAVVVFVADGGPCCGDCNAFYEGSNYEDIGTIASLTAAALSSYSIPTYTVALDGGALASCDAIAAAGGTSNAYNATGDITVFLDALEDIRWTNYGCEYIAPNPAEVDLLKINVVYTHAGIGNPEIIPQVDTLLDCGIIIPGWYFNDLVDPTSILLCPNCRYTIEQDPDPLLQLAIGCPTVTN